MFSLPTPQGLWEYPQAWTYLLWEIIRKDWPVEAHRFTHSSQFPGCCRRGNEWPLGVFSYLLRTSWCINEELMAIVTCRSVGPLKNWTHWCIWILRELRCIIRACSCHYSAIYECFISDDLFIDISRHSQVVFGKHLMDIGHLENNDCDESGKRSWQHNKISKHWC